MDDKKRSRGPDSGRRTPAQLVTTKGETEGGENKERPWNLGTWGAVWRRHGPGLRLDRQEVMHQKFVALHLKRAAEGFSKLSSCKKLQPKNKIAKAKSKCTQSKRIFLSTYRTFLGQACPSEDTKGKHTGETKPGSHKPTIGGGPERLESGTSTPWRVSIHKEQRSLAWRQHPSFGLSGPPRTHHQGTTPVSDPWTIRRGLEVPFVLEVFLVFF